MSKPKSDDDDYPEVFIGFGALHQLKDKGSRKKPNPIGFVHFPDKPAKKQRRAKAVKQRKRKK